MPVIAALVDEQAELEEALSNIGDTYEREQQADRAAKRAFGHWDAALDTQTAGPRWLADPRVAEMVAAALHRRHGQVYNLATFCIMPNHVHIVYTPLEQEDGTYVANTRILQSLKGYTARQANRILQREGPFWQAESYDRVVRDAAELERIVIYVLNNPVKAGLVAEWQHWPWSWCKPAWISPEELSGCQARPTNARRRAECHSATCPSAREVSGLAAA